MISRNFIKRSFIYTVAGTLPMGSAIILLPFYIHHLTAAAYGALSIYLALALLVQILVTYSFDSSLYIHFHEYKNEWQKLTVFVSSSFVFVLILGISVGFVLLLSGNALITVFFKDQGITFFPNGAYSVGIGIFQAVFKVFSNLTQAREKPETYLWSNFVMFSLIALLTIVGLHIFPGSLVGPLAGRLIASAMVGVWALFRVFREFGFHYDFHWLKTSFSFNNYTFLYQLQQWVLNYFDRILMAMFLPLQFVGIYDFGMKCMIVLEIILNSLHNSYYPKVVGGIMEQTQKGSTVVLNRYYYGTTSIVMLITASAILFFPLLINIFIWKPEYRDSIIYLPLIAVPYLFKTMRLYFAAPYGILKKVHLLSKTYFFLAVTKIALMVMLIPKLHIFGVIAASVISSFVEIVLLHHYIKPHFRFQYNPWKLIIGPTILFLLIAGTEFIIPPGHVNLAHSGYLVVCIGLLVWMYRNEIGLLFPNRQSGKV